MPNALPKDIAADTLLHPTQVNMNKYDLWKSSSFMLVCSQRTHYVVGYQM